MSHAPHLNKAQCRKFMLAYAERSRHHKFTRVGDSVFDTLESRLRDAMRNIVDSHPSKGKTIK